MRRPVTEDAEELPVRVGLVELILVDDHGLRPKRRNGPVRDPNHRGTAVEGASDLGEVARPDQPLGTEYQLLTTTAQCHARLLAERNHDVGETVQEVGLIVKSGAITALEIAVRCQRAPPLGVDAEIRGHVKIGIQPEPGQEVSIRAFWCRRAELELIKVFHTLTDLTAEAKPNILIGSERDIFQAVPKIVGLASVHPFQGRPVLVEPSR